MAVTRRERDPRSPHVRHVSPSATLSGGPILVKSHFLRMLAVASLSALVVAACGKTGAIPHVPARTTSRDPESRRASSSARTGRSPCSASRARRSASWSAASGEPMRQALRTSSRATASTGRPPASSPRRCSAPSRCATSTASSSWSARARGRARSRSAGRAAARASRALRLLPRPRTRARRPCLRARRAHVASDDR